MNALLIRPWILALGAAAPGLAQAQQGIPEGWAVQGKLQGFLIICESAPAKTADKECKPWLTPEQLAQMSQAITPAVIPATAPAAAPQPSPGAKALAATGDGETAAAPTAPKPDPFKAVTTAAQSDLSVPSSPAFAVLGIAPDKVQRPGIIRDFAASLVRGLGPDGKVSDGIAMDISPASLFFRGLIRGGDQYGPSAGSHSDLDFKNWGTRVLARTTVSLATTKPDDSGASKAAWGLRVGLYDQADPGLYYEVLNRCLLEQPMPDMVADKNLDAVAADLSQCPKEIEKLGPLWAKPSLYAGFGQSWYSATNSLGNKVPDAKVVWLAGSYGFAGKGAEPDGLRVLLQGFLSRRLDDRVPDTQDASKLLRQDATEASLRLRIGQQRYHFYGEYGLRRIRLGGDVTERVQSRLFGAEIKLPFSTDADEYWLQLAGVRERGFSDGTDRNAVNVNLKFGMPFLQVPGTK